MLYEEIVKKISEANITSGSAWGTVQQTRENLFKIVSRVYERAGGFAFDLSLSDFNKQLPNAVLDVIQNSNNAFFTDSRYMSMVKEAFENMVKALAIDVDKERPVEKSRVNGTKSPDAKVDDNGYLVTMADGTESDNIKVDQKNANKGILFVAVAAAVLLLVIVALKKR